MRSYWGTVVDKIISILVGKRTAAATLLDRPEGGKCGEMAEAHRRREGFSNAKVMPQSSRLCPAE